MPDANNHVFTHSELAELMVKRLDLHEGLWGIYIEFNMFGTNIPLPPDGVQLTPAAICTVSKVGLQRFDKPGNLTVDAAIVNPAEKPLRAKKKVP